jgi:hypothetical protein
MQERYNYIVDYKIEGRFGTKRTLVAAEDLEAATRAAKQKVGLPHWPARTEVVNVVRTGKPLTEKRPRIVTENPYVDPFAALETIATSLCEAPKRTGYHWSEDEKAAFIAIQALLDADRDVPGALLDFHENAGLWIHDYFSIDLNDDSRTPVEALEALESVASTLHDSWLSRYYDAFANEGRGGTAQGSIYEVDFKDNQLVKGFMIAVETLRGAGSLDRYHWMNGTYREVAPLYAEANPSLQLAM